MNERIRRLRKTLDMTQQEFADKLGVKRNTVGQWECGINGITDQVAISICREFNVNENWLRTGEGDMFVERTRDEQIASFVGSLQANADDSFKKRFISMLSALDDAEWEVLEKMAIMRIRNDVHIIPIKKGLGFIPVLIMLECSRVSVLIACRLHVQVIL